MEGGSSHQADVEAKGVSRLCEFQGYDRTQHIHMQIEATQAVAPRA